MATKSAGKTFSARVVQRRMPTSTAVTKDASCNSFTARILGGEVVLQCGVDERGNSAQPQAKRLRVRHEVTLTPATARQLREKLSELLQKPGAPRVSIRAQINPLKKPS